MPFNFRSYVSDGCESNDEREGFTLTAKVVHDESMGEPWKEHDGHGPVSEWTRRGKTPGERVLCEHRGQFRYYDMAESVRIARKDQWGVAGGRKEGESPRAYAARAAEDDFKALRAWAQDEWFWCGVVVTAEKEGVELGSASLWGIEANYPGSDNSYLAQVAEELAPEALTEARAKISSLTR